MSVEIKLKRSVLVGDADVMPTAGGTVVTMDAAKAREFIAAGLADEVSAKKAPETDNKMADEPENKSRRGRAS